MHCILQLLLILLYLRVKVEVNARTEEESYYSLKQDDGGGPSSIVKNKRDNYAVIISASTYFHNYRHTSNAASIYHTIKSLGNIPDENIIFMVATDTSIDNRNVYAHTVRSYIPHQRSSLRDNVVNVFQNVDIDYRGRELSPASFRRILLGKQGDGYDLSSRSLLGMNEDSNILIYMTGHGGDEFFKFHDQTELTSVDIANIIHEMKILRRFRNMMWMVDTCQAFTLQNDISKVVQEEIMGIDDDNTTVIFVGSSLVNENSYAYGSEQSVGQSIMDRFTKWFVEYMWKQKNYFDRLLLKKNFLDHFDYQKLHSTIGFTAVSSSSSEKNSIDSTKITDFFQRDIDYGELLSMDDAIDFILEEDEYILGCN